MSETTTNDLPAGKLAYSPSEAAAAAGVSVRSIFKQIEAKRLDARKLGARTLIPADSLKALIASLPARDAVAA